MKPLRETDLVRACLVWLQLRYPTGVFWRANTGAFAGEYKGRKRFVRFGVPGMSDIQGVLGSGPRRGLAVFIECKIGKQKQSDSQIVFEEAVTRAGGFYAVVRSIADLEAIALD